MSMPGCAVLPRSSKQGVPSAAFVPCPIPGPIPVPLFPSCCLCRSCVVSVCPPPTMSISGPAGLFVLSVCLSVGQSVGWSASMHEQATRQHLVPQRLPNTTACEAFIKWRPRLRGGRNTKRPDQLRRWLLKKKMCYSPHTLANFPPGMLTKGGAPASHRRPFSITHQAQTMSPRCTPILFRAQMT